MNFGHIVAIVTGAAGKYGLAITERILKKGGKVCMVDIARDKLADRAEELLRTYCGNELTYFQCDVTEDHAFRAVFRHVRYVFGTVDVLVNAASVRDNEVTWERNVTVNLGSVLNCSRIACDYFHETNKNGVVVNIGSISGVKPEQYIDQPISTSAWAGVVAYTRCLAARCPTVRTICICPSDVAYLKFVEPLRLTGTTATSSPDETSNSPPISVTLAGTFEKVVMDENNSGTVVVIDNDNEVTFQ